MHFRKIMVLFLSFNIIFSPEIALGNERINYYRHGDVIKEELSLDETEQDIYDINNVDDYVEQNPDIKLEYVEDISSELRSRRSAIATLWDDLSRTGKLFINERGLISLKGVEPHGRDLVYYLEYTIDSYNEAIEDGNLIAYMDDDMVVISLPTEVQRLQNEMADEVVSNSDGVLKNKAIGVETRAKASSSHNCEYKKIDLYKLCESNRNEIKNKIEAYSIKTNGKAMAVIYWVNKVKEGGDWDYKRQALLGPASQTYCSYYQGAFHHITAEYIGNYNYGFTGRGLLPLATLHAGSVGAAKFKRIQDLTDWPGIDDGFYSATPDYNISANDYNLKLSWINNPSTMYEGETNVWTVDCVPQSTVVWSSSNTKVVSVSNGHVAAKGAGTATITASANGLVLSQKVTVKPSVLEWTSTPSVYQGERKSWLVNALPSNGMVWKSGNEAIAKVNSSGIIEGVGKGKTTIYVTVGNKTISKDINIVEKNLSTTVTSINMYTHDEYVWKVTSTPKTSIVYSSSNKDIATVDSNGKVSTKGRTGYVRITAKAHNKTVALVVNVINPTISIKKHNKTMYIGEGQQLNATATPNRGVTWSVPNSSKASISSSGYLTAKQAGTVRVYAYVKDSNIGTYSDIQVKKGDLKWNKTYTTMYEGGIYSWTVTQAPSKGSVKWTSSNPKVAIVDNGKVTALKPGTSKITASFAGASITTTVTVKSPTLSWQTSYISLYKGESKSFSVNKQPSNAKITWSSSNPKIATVNNGKVTGVASGKVTITASIKGASVSKTVTIVNPTVKIDAKKLTLYEGESTNWSYTARPYSSSAKWKSSSTYVASILNGKITAKNRGTTTITVEVNGVKASQKLTVLSPSVTWKNTSSTIRVNHSYSFTVNCKPTGTIKWTTSNSNIAIVDSNGRVTGKKPGNVTIYATVTFKIGSKTTIKKIKKNVTIIK